MSLRPLEPTGRCVRLCSCLLSSLPGVATVDVAFGCLGVPCPLRLLVGVEQLAETAVIISPLPEQTQLIRTVSFSLQRAGLRASLCKLALADERCHPKAELRRSE